MTWEDIAQPLDNFFTTNGKFQEWFGNAMDSFNSFGDQAIDFFKSYFETLLGSNAVNPIENLKYLDGLLASFGDESQMNRDYNSAQAAINRDFQSQEAELQRKWYTDLSSSAYQRSMADMKAAGLNPILAFQQGGAASASTGVPVGSAATINNAGGDTATGVLNAVASLISALKGKSSIMNFYGKR